MVLKVLLAQSRKLEVPRRNFARRVLLFGNNVETVQSQGQSLKQCSVKGGSPKKEFVEQKVVW